jgi:ElaB/YqjD/DUF883 family membrane-anchored ribosome-binding protein
MQANREVRTGDVNSGQPQEAKLDNNQTMEDSVKSTSAKMQDKLTEFGEDAANRVRSNLNRAGENLRSTAGTAADEMREMGGNLAETVAGTVREQPLASLLLVGGLGLILGFLLRR